VPVQPEVVYVPVYDPMVIYGPWWYPAFRPFFFPPPPGVIIVRGFGFWRGVAVGRAWGHAWGHWDWRHRHVNVNINRRININRHMDITRANIQTTRWKHDVSHRKGVSYRNEVTRERYGQLTRGAEKRRDFRGFGQETKYQQPSVATRQDLGKTKGGQAPVATRRSLPDTKGGQASVIARKDVPKTKGGQAPVTTYQGPEQRKGAGGFDQKSLDLSKNKSAFGGVGRGSDARMQSDRGFQSRQSMPSKGTGGVSKDNVGRPR